MGELRYNSTLSSTSSLDGVDSQRHTPGRDVVPIVQKAGLAPDQIGTENLAPTVFDSRTVRPLGS